MSQLGPHPGAARKPPSRLVFEDDAPWLVFGAGLELSDIPRNNQLGERLWTPRTHDIVNDKQLEQRYRAVGIEHLFFVYAITDPGEQRSRITRYGDRAFGKGSFPDAPERPLGEEFDAWLAPRVRAALEGYRRLPRPSRA